LNVSAPRSSDPHSSTEPRRPIRRMIRTLARASLRSAGAGARPLLRLVHVFDVVWKSEPRMLPLLPDRSRRRREGRICERAHRDGHNSRRGLRGVEHGRAAVRTEAEERRVSLPRLRRECTAARRPRSLPVLRRIALGHRRRFQFDAGRRDSGRSRLEPALPRR
jgi:hypothetical protein